MNPLMYKLAYLAVLILAGLIRAPHQLRNYRNRIKVNREGIQERLLQLLTFIGMILLPLVHILTPVLSFADFQPPLWMPITGLILIAPMLWLFYRSHLDLGRNWSVTLKIRADHHIVDTGVYRHVRHPMYSAIWLWVILQALLLHNYFAGFGGLLSFGLMYGLRIHDEEKMMLAEFGEAYQAYCAKTKRLIPYVY
jgi:protein-S-isoprenylcysteine O-methyltransferase Ste14